MTEHVDRRVRRTRTQLHRALIELMLERDYARISVRDILDRADIGRSTFYTHFRDKDDLLLVSSIEYVRAAISAPLPPDPDAPPETERLAPIHRLFVLAEQHPDVYGALLGRSAGGVVLRATRGVVGRLLTEQLAGRLTVTEDEFDTTITFLSWGVTGLLASIAESGGALTARAAYDTVTGLLGEHGSDGTGEGRTYDGDSASGDAGSPGQGGASENGGAPGNPDGADG
ncbi:TetR/AcrR family transcriptional regulator [Nocardia shimofusensis]|uniref:TetR/AcrR family transcriptional regulator n=1 Tax=Nocardia shimofusensis TaxID=228596 RepID=UPI000830813F|nr:TetR/AcrR family transcriptional regulator [Nocardia shimofusensis]